VSIARIFTLSRALMFVAAIGAAAFTPAAYASEPADGGKAKLSSKNRGMKPAERCCAGRRR
jgi:hypothetical protein